LNLDAGRMAVKVVRNLDQLPEELRGGALSIGNYDGVHRGHARIVHRLRTMADACGGAAVVFTFDPSPARLLRPDQAPIPLTWLERKVELLDSLGVDGLVVYPTDRAFLDLEAEAFFEQIVVRRMGARGLVEGANFFFGRQRRGTVDLLAELCAARGVALEVIPSLTVAGQMVSSSRVRRLVGSGQVDEARELLTQPYRIRGLVVHGAGRGATLGYPTANLDRCETLIPAEGIYAGRAWAEGRFWPAAISVGTNPTFSDGRLKIEVYLVDYQGDLYDQWLEVDFLSRLRGVQKFSSVPELLSQMARDVEVTRGVAQPFLTSLPASSSYDSLQDVRHD